MDNTTTKLFTDMESSENDLEIRQLLFAIECELGPILKNRANTHFNYRYVDLNQLLDTLKPLLQNFGISLHQYSHIMVVEGKVFARITTRLDLPKEDQWIKFPTDVPIAKFDPQEFGKALTYGRRYGLLSFFNIETEDDDAHTNVHGDPKKEHRELLERVKTLIDSDEKFIEENLVKWAAEKEKSNATKLSELSTSGLRRIIKVITTKG